MSNVFNNLKLLKLDMEKNNIVIDAFNFEYKNNRYIVLVKLFDKKEKIPEYALVKLEFLDEDNLERRLSVYANVRKFFIDAKTFREFFYIEYSKNLGDIFKQFYEYFSKFIPTKVNKHVSEIQKEAMVVSLSRSDSEDPGKIYCFSVKRNPEKQDGSLGQRSPFNDNKTKLLRPVLHELLSDDPYLSFLYSDDPNKEKTDSEIMELFSKKI